MAPRASLASKLRLEIGKRDTLAALCRMLIGLMAQRLLLGLLGYYVLFGLLASLLIPPWQAPDEPAHFEYVRNIQSGVVDESPTVLRPIIASFYTFDFWRYVGKIPPKSMPQSLTAPSLQLIRQTFKAPLYYWLAAAAASWTNNLLLQLYSVRWLSILLSALTIPLVYATAREVLPPSRNGLALIAAALVAFLPMYSYIGASVNPDNIGAPLAAGTTLLAVRALRGKRPVVMSFAALALAVFAFWARRSTIAVIPWTLLVASACAIEGLRRRLPRAVVVVLVSAIAVISILLIAWPSDRLAGWSNVGSNWGATRSGREAYEGRYSLYIARSAKTRQAGLVQYLSASQLRMLRGRPVALDTVVRSNKVTTTGHLALIAGGTQVAVSSFAANSNWQHLRLTYVVPTDTRSLVIQLAADSPGELFFDQIRLLDPSVAQPAVWVSNSGGEEALFWWQQRFGGYTGVQYLTQIIQDGRDGVYSSPTARTLYPWFLSQLFSSLIGRFGWMIFGLSDSLYLAIGLVWALLCLGVIGAWRQTSGVNHTQRRVLIWLALFLMITIVILLLGYTPHLYFNTFPQGRYLFPALAAIAALLVSGLAQWLPTRYDRYGTMIALALMIALQAWSWGGVIIPYFYR